MQMYTNRGAYLRNAILVTDIVCYRYLTINNSANKLYFSTKFGQRFSNFLGVKLAKFCLNLFIFDVFYCMLSRGYFFPATVYYRECITNGTVHVLYCSCLCYACCFCNNFLHVVCCGSAKHKDMLRTFWHTNRIRNPETSSFSHSLDSARRLSADAPKVSCTILQDYKDDMRKRFRNSGAPADWTEVEKVRNRRTAVEDQSRTGSGSPLNAAESLVLQASKMPSSSASSASTLEWKMDAFLLLPGDYQRYCTRILLCIELHMLDGPH